MSDFLKHARYYVRHLKWSVIPLKKSDKRPALPSWKEFQGRLPTDAELLQWFTDGNHNIGIVTGTVSGGLAVVDLDSQDAIMYSIEQNFPTTARVQTGKGAHLYYRTSEAIRNFQCRDDLPGIDLRAEGGYVVAPPSLHPSGKIYEWSTKPTTEGVWPLPEMPSVILQVNGNGKKPVSDLYDGVQPGARNHALARLVGSWIAEGETIDAVYNLAFGWNNQLPEKLPVNEVERTIKSIWDRDTENRLKEVREALAAPQRANITGVGGNHEWPDVVPISDKFPDADFPFAALPGVFSEFVQMVAESVQVDPAMPGVMLLAVLSCCWQRKIELELHNFIEPCNLYVAPIAGSGERKSAALNELCKPIWEMQAEEHENNKEASMHAINEKEILEQEIKGLKLKASKINNSEERMSVVIDLRSVTEQLAAWKDPKPHRFTCDDVTNEALGRLMAENGETIACLAAEGGIFDNLQGLYNEQGHSNIDIYLKSYSGEHWENDRIGRGYTMMKNPLLTACLAVQPNVIQRLGQNGLLRGRGFHARWLFNLCRPLAGTRFIDTGKQIDGNTRCKYHNTIRRFLSFKPQAPVILKLSPEAKSLWVLAYDDIESRQKTGGDLYDMQDWASKQPGRIGRIATILHAAEHGPACVNIPISEKTMEDAIYFSIYFIAHARHIYSHFMGNEAVIAASVVSDFIQRYTEQVFTIRDILRHTNLKKTAEIQPGLDLLIEYGHIREAESTPKLRLKNRQQKATTYLINPKIKLF